MKNWLREPLIHFVVLGAGLFLAHGLWAKHVQKADYTIAISAAEIERQAAIFATENQRQPTDEDIQSLLFAHVEEQVLMREAERLGLGEDDTIIRRRLAQKMRFMIEDSAPPELPSDADLEDWFDDHKDEFIVPEKRGFSHIYLSPGQHSDIESDGQKILENVTDENWQTLGDPFIEQSSYGLMDKLSVSRKFGRSFAVSLFDLEPTADWQGPIESSFGLHVVRVDTQNEERQPSFDEARADIEARWLDQASRQGNHDRLEALLKQYKIEVEDTE